VAGAAGVSVGMGVGGTFVEVLKLLLAKLLWQAGFGLQEIGTSCHHTKHQRKTKIKYHSVSLATPFSH